MQDQQPAVGQARSFGAGLGRIARRQATLPPAEEDNLQGLAAYAADQERRGLRRTAQSSGSVHRLAGSASGLDLLAGSTTPGGPRPMRRESTWSTWERHNAQEGAQTQVDPANMLKEEQDFQECVTVSKYVKYFLKSVLNYDAEAIIGPGVFLAASAAASILARKQLLRDMFIIFLGTAALSVTFCLRDIRLEAVDMDRLSHLVSDFQSLCTFLLGFFVSTCLTRWWAIRNDCIGCLWGCADDLALIIGSYFGQDTPEDREVRERLRRWSLLSHELVYKQARAQDDMSDLVDRGFLLESELEILLRECSKPQVIWAWMCSYFTHLAYGDPRHGGSRLPYPVTVLPQLHEICRKARGGIGSAFMYTDTQVPFRYVHFLALIIWMSNLFQAVHSAAVISNAYLSLNEQYMSVTVELVFLTFHPLIYFGLLHLGCGMLNPLRAKRDIDFPSGAWVYFMNAEIRSLFSANVKPNGPPWGEPPVWRPGGDCISGSPTSSQATRGSAVGGSRRGSVRGMDTHVFQGDLAAALEEESPQN